MEVLWKIKNKLNIKFHSTGPWTEGVRKHVLNEDGGVGFVCKCNHYDLESDKFGYCRDEDCRYTRMVRAFYSGEAIKLKDGTIVWTPGNKIVKG